MLKISMGDMAICMCPAPTGIMVQSGPVVSGDPMNILGGRLMSSMGDIVMAGACGPYTITMGSPNYLDLGLLGSTMGAQCVGAGTGQVITGDPSFILM